MIESRYVVMVVDDEPADADWAKERLSASARGRFAVVCARSAADAERQLAARRVDAVLLDLQLPDAEGAETVRRLRAAAGDAAIVVYSGRSEDAVFRAAATEGAADFLRKGTGPELLETTLALAIERERATRAHRRLQRILEAVPDAILVSEEPGVIRYANRAAARLLGRRQDDLLGEPVGFSVGVGGPAEIVVPRDGGGLVCEMRVAPIEWDGRAATLASLRDVTERREMESRLQEADRMATLGTLSAGVAHEINNPLAAVVANLELACAEADALGAAKLQSLLAEAADSAARTRSLARDIGVFARAEDDASARFDVRRAVQAALRLARHEIRHRARVVERYAEGPLDVVANESRLGQVFLNLIVNAAQAFAAGNPERNEIRVAAYADGSRVTVSVADNGRGIPEQDVERIFRPFFTTKPAGVGTGLGLSICRRIVAASGGEIRVESAVGKGATFFVSLPGCGGSAANGEPDRRAATAAAAAPAKARPSALVVDDDRHVANAVSRVLEAEYDVRTVGSAATALELIRAGGAFDVIVSDFLMPEMSGADFYRELSALGAGHEAKVVFMTGDAFERETREFLDRIPNPRVDKPFELAALRRAVAAAARGGAVTRRGGGGER